MSFTEWMMQFNFTLSAYWELFSQRTVWSYTSWLYKPVLSKERSAFTLTPVDDTIYSPSRVFPICSRKLQQVTFLLNPEDTLAPGIGLSTHSRELLNWMPEFTKRGTWQIILPATKKTFWTITEHTQGHTLDQSPPEGDYINPGVRIWHNCMK